MFYSPFTDENGNMLSLDKIQYYHLKQINEKGLSEGYRIEFKELFDDSLKKKHLCKEITSFANTDGGWLFIGIRDNGELSDIDLQTRTDFDVTITNILKEHTSPIPKYDFKVLQNPENNGKGILTLYIPPSRFAPFVSDGSIYIRNGSSAIPAKRPDIDYLYQSHKEMTEEIKQFCHYDFYDRIPNKFPHCYIYLFNPDSIDYLDPFELDELYNSEKPNNIGSINRSTNSVIFYNTKPTDCTSFYEYFDNHNIKLGCPLITCKSETFPNNFKDYLSNELTNNLISHQPIDGYRTTLIISQLLSSTLQILKRFYRNLQSYYLVFEFKNVQNSFIVFQEQIVKQLAYFKEKGFRYCPQKETKNRPFPLINIYDLANHEITNNDLAIGDIYTLVMSSIIMGNSFGYSFEEFFDFIMDSHKNTRFNQNLKYKISI